MRIRYLNRDIEEDNKSRTFRSCGTQVYGGAAVAKQRQAPNGVDA
jgi:hypothetical protein